MTDLHRRCSSVVALATGALVACAGPGSAPTDDHGIGSSPILVMAADPSPEGVTLWARAPDGGPVEFELTGDGARRTEVVEIAAGADGTVSHRFAGLEPEVDYRYRVRQGQASSSGRFVAPPAPEVRAAVRFAWGGDVAGQNACRDVNEGFPAIRRMVESRPTFVIGLGDMIYADSACTGTGRFGNAQLPDSGTAAETRPEIQAKWRYVREAAGVRDLLARAGYYAVWDDHEVINDFSPAGAGALYGPARVAFLDYNPVPETGGGFARAVRWGRHLELFILDTRTFRDPNDAPDRPGKSMLGEAQRRWLIDGVADSDATWKIVVSSVPISIPTGWPPEGPRDGWASEPGETGYEWELGEILRAWAAAGVVNVVFLTTDIHHATGFSYRPYPEYPAFELTEFATGPLNAGIFPTDALDSTFNPLRILRHAPRRAEDVRTWEEALGWFNFGLLEIDPNGRLENLVVNARGEIVARTVLEP